MQPPVTSAPPPPAPPTCPAECSCSCTALPPATSGPPTRPPPSYYLPQAPSRVVINTSFLHKLTKTRGHVAKQSYESLAKLNIRHNYWTISQSSTQPPPPPPPSTTTPPPSPPPPTQPPAPSSYPGYPGTGQSSSGPSSGPSSSYQSSSGPGPDPSSPPAESGSSWSVWSSSIPEVFGPSELES